MMKPFKANEIQMVEGFKNTEVGIIPSDWEVKAIGDISIISVGKDLKKENYSKDQDSNYKYPVYSNTVLGAGLYGYYNVSEFSGESLTVVGRGVGLGTAFKRSEEYGAIGRLLVLMPHKNIDAKYLTEFINYKINIFFESSGVPQLTGISFAKYKVALPPTKAEQTAIALALSEVEGLITQLEKLIAKKRNIKQGAMQKCLNPDFWDSLDDRDLKDKKKSGQSLNHINHSSDKWQVKKLGKIAEIYQPQTISQDVFVKDGYLVYGANGIVGMYDKYNHETWQTTITCRGSTCGTVNRTIDKCWITGNAMVINVDRNISIDKLFFYYILANQDFRKCITGSGQPQIIKTPLREFEIQLPEEKAKQIHIAQILSDMDTEIESLEKKLEKYKMLKQGMMQNLLTGKIRLI
ncbi:MAG: restriction endonuclease subunit S [Bacteroidota bacterium]|nr:restriction endonuclease subunit S [Bacteroidota bacterium]